MPPAVRARRGDRHGRPRKTDRVDKRLIVLADDASVECLCRDPCQRARPPWQWLPEALPKQAAGCGHQSGDGSRTKLRGDGIVVLAERSSTEPGPHDTVSGARRVATHHAIQCAGCQFLGKPAPSVFFLSRRQLRYVKRLAGKHRGRRKRTTRLSEPVPTTFASRSRRPMTPRQAARASSSSNRLSWSSIIDDFLPERTDCHGGEHARCNAQPQRPYGRRRRRSQEQRLETSHALQVGGEGLTARRTDPRE